ncbi:MULTISPECIES: MetQ/NlpA family ABC transporter substrate-binding protein [Bacillus]|uniref:Lipoprotein n=1 Tax=Bacillus infantis NRRL B-14911 TaxID=1367477 RepID=U5LFN8_9BACI|nr:MULTISPECIES: MetQ/NlpA family ABC transporter substrate-binding protein [Bacillus]AGX06208.1 methionine ABC transporter substrate-binding protein [Bacillus infantis NRRL B-14911]EAR65544.1 YhcJ [Bacillus sp. NRRL B-14911]MCP1160459.1 MetQ/NlpA family ABC transporter substrate-binding protein [Bacillus infantis]MDT0162201.1 MetQ/NlpA family ABC transporter substrate-binding protein [Bacillus sp. AG4(2022)]PLR73752.1 MetQ/NlpA family ABC transporter substrate-binding protein [Bacillus sp. UM
MKKLLLTAIILALAVFSAACSSSTSGKEKEKEVKIGVSGSDNRIWDFVAKKAEKEGIKVEIVRFSDYVQPNIALAEGELDANAFQTISYFNAFKKEHDLDLSPIATTVIAPMGIYSEKYKDVKDIPEGGKIAVPNEATNMGRSFLLLQEAGLITLPEDFDGNGSIDKIVDNPKNLEIVPVVAGQTPRVLPDVAASIINNGIAVDAGFNPVEDSIFHESATATPYINIIAARTEDKDNETLKRLGELYQEDDVAEFIEKEYKGSTIPTFVPLSEIGE